MQYYAKKIAEKGFVYEMQHAGFKAKLMRAPRLKDIGRAHGLPAGDPIPVFPIAALPGAPADWVRGPGTYVCPVDSDWGLWFDWTSNDHLNTAVLPSVKGMNPITGQKLESLRLEEYSDRCPVHDEPFAHDNLCEKCGYKWPPQGFVSAPNILWFDGFRVGDKVRQFFFSEDEKRDIASLVIGKENTVPAFGFAFYRPKNPRTPPPSPIRARAVKDFGCFGGVKIGSYYSGPKYGTPISAQSMNVHGTVTVCDTADIAREGAITQCYAAMAAPMADCAAAEESVFTSADVSMEREVKTSGLIKDVSVGAGAEIQELVRDSLGVKGWQEEPAALIRLYFCFETQFNDIVKKSGRVKEMVSRAEGYLKGLPVG